VDIVLGMDWNPQAFSIAQNTAFLAFTGWLLSLAPRNPAQDRAGDGPPLHRPEPAANPALARLQRLMEEERLHLDPELTFPTFVEAMGMPERTVRRLINHELGYEHFRSFLNAYRVEAAKRLLSDPARCQDKLVGVALDSGFASLPSFNRVFKELDGRTPSAFRAEALAVADGPRAGINASQIPTRPSETPSEERSAAF
jgi:transcriptional regulator GlxA family with amidase domain